MSLGISKCGQKVEMRKRKKENKGPEMKAII